MGYFAPEILEGPYTNKIDLFSAGIVCFMLIDGTPPFGYTHDDENAVMERNRIGRIRFDERRWYLINPFAIDLIKRMTALDPDIRPTASEAL